MESAIAIFLSHINCDALDFSEPYPILTTQRLLTMAYELPFAKRFIASLLSDWYSLDTSIASF